MGARMSSFARIALVFGLAFMPSAAGAQKGGKGAKASKAAAAKKAPPPAAPAAENQTSASQERLNEANRLFRSEQYGQAAVAFYELMNSPEGAAVKDAAEYSLGKALYRMKLNHSALVHFAALLARGPENKHYRSALEWSLFIARKMTADERVLDLIAKYSDGRFPEDYKDEFRYLLARYHYSRALAIESGAEMGRLGETEVKETVTGGLSLSGDVFSGGGGEEEAPEKEDDEEAVKTKEGGGFTVEDDIFGDDAPKSEPKKKEKGKKGKKGKKGLEIEPEQPALTPPPPPPSAEKTPPPPSAPKPAGAEGFTAKEHFEAASRYLTQVDARSEFAARAKFLEGVMLYHDNRDNDSLAAFKQVLNMTKDRDEPGSRKLRQLSFFQLARAHFGAKQPTFSIFYYAKIRRFTYEWLEALYEASWAEFRLGNYEKSLGNLLTLHSPFFNDQYFPESHILKAVVYYENCRFPETKSILDEFKRRYEPVHEELKGLTARTQTAEKYYEYLQNLRNDELAEGSSEKAKILSQVLAIALSDDELRDLDGSYREVDTELRSFDGAGPVFAQSRLRGALDEEVGKVRADLQREAGKAVKRRLEFERDQIKGLLGQALRIEIETSRAEQERIEATLRDVSTRPADNEREFVEWSDDEKLVWAFDDEYWRDELGTYQLTLAHSCRP